MTVANPVDPYAYPLVRIMVMPQGKWTSGGQPWQALPATPRQDYNGRVYYGNPDSPNGFDLEMVERACLPDAGAAVFHFDYGTINGKLYDTDSSDPSAIYSAQNYAGYDVRIQMAEPPIGSSINFTPAWSTVFLGTIVAVEDTPFSGSDAYGGRRTYRCADLLSRAQRWPMDRHTTYRNGSFCVHARGNPGYNWAIQGYFRRVLGNKEPTGVNNDPYGDLGALAINYKCHTWSGTGEAATWNDLEVVNHALVSSRSAGEPVFYMSGSTSLLSFGQFAWPVSPGSDCFSFINRILDRKRARGVAYLDWSEASPDGPITPFITITPQTGGDVVVSNPSGGSPVTFPGATTAGTTVAVDLNGDARLVPGSLSLVYNDTGVIDYLESQGEPIEILVTLSPGDGTLDKRWNISDEALYEAIDPSSVPWQRLTNRWRPLWQRWGLNPDFLWYAKDGNGGTSQYINFYCDDSGAIKVGGSSGQAYETKSDSALVARVLSDIPIYEGYNYSSYPPVRFDGTVDTFSPPRLPPLVLLNSGSGEYLDAALALGASVSNDDWGIFLTCSNDAATGNRSFSDTTKPVYGAIADASQLVVSLGLQLGVPVRMASSNGGATYLTSCRRKIIKYEGLSLWLADSQAIWSINYASGSSSYWPRDPQRGAGGGSGTTPGILRDDRSQLAFLHCLAWEWYRNVHLTGQWTLEACGLLAGYPTLGMVVTTISSDSVGTYDPLTPITRIRYSASGQTTWVIDWNDLDL